jgi:hypothetical protein
MTATQTPRRREPAALPSGGFLFDTGGSDWEVSVAD